jgi:hypothetical protein
MGNAEKRPLPHEEPFSSTRNSRNSTPLILAMVAATVVVVVTVTLIVLFTRNKTTPSRPDPYTARLQISNVRMATAQNFAGGSVTYIEGTLSNLGDKRVTSARVQVIFKNSLGEIVQDEVLPVMVLQPDAPIVDYGPMERAPLGPGQSRDFRVTLEHVTADWNSQIPQIKVVAVSTT